VENKAQSMPDGSSRRVVRAGFDAGPWLDLKTGVGRYALELADALEQIGVDLAPYAVSLRGSSPRRVRRWRMPARVAQSAWRRFDAPRITRLTGPVDLVHATNFVLPALPAATPGVVTIHDLSFLRDDPFPGAARLRQLVPWSLARAARILTPTRAVAEEVAEQYRLDADRIHVTHEGVSPLFFGAAPLADRALAAHGIGRPYAIAVGTIEPRKNLARLIDAWRAARTDLDGWTLVLAGPQGWGPTLSPTPGVVPIGWVGDETLPGLLAAAEIFCYPSLYEGFGLPPVEAMAASTACLVGDYPAAAEVVGEAAVRVDPENTGAIAMQLSRLAADDVLRRRLALAGRARAASFTWAATARKTLDAYLSVL
jgi:glycosyltransferase involved in cell wall biosynthesis